MEGKRGDEGLMAVLCYRVDWWGGCEYVFEDISAVVWDAGFWGAGE